MLCDVNMSSDVRQGKANGGIDREKVCFVLAVRDSTCLVAFELDLLYTFGSGRAVMEIN